MFQKSLELIKIKALMIIINVITNDLNWKKYISNPSRYLVNKIKKIEPINYNIPSDISSSAFFIVLTALTKNSVLLIKDVNINSSRTGIIKILKKMGPGGPWKKKLAPG